MAPEQTTFIPVNVITGFLGSGKTTLLRRLLAAPQLSDTAVLVNEFGEVGLDHHLLQRIDDEIVLLQSAVFAARSGAILVRPCKTFTRSENAERLFPSAAL